MDDLLSQVSEIGQLQLLNAQDPGGPLPGSCVPVCSRQCRHIVEGCMLRLQMADEVHLMLIQWRVIGTYPCHFHGPVDKQ